MTDRAAELVRAIGRRVENVVLFTTIDSTHAAALRLIDQVDCEDLTLRPTVVLAESQSHGLGRGGRRWVSPSGGLYLSWVASIADEPLIPLMPMLSASAALRAIDEAGVEGATIKWPNDILVAGRKLAEGAKKKDAAFYEGQIMSARFFINNFIPVTLGKMSAILANDGTVVEISEDAFGGK